MFYRSIIIIGVICFVLCSCYEEELRQKNVEDVEDKETEEANVLEAKVVMIATENDLDDTKFAKPSSPRSKPPKTPATPEHQRQKQPKSPAHPPPKSPAHPPPKSPTNPPPKSPAHPPPKSSTNPPPKSPAHAPPKSPAHAPPKSKVQPPPKSPTHPATSSEEEVDDDNTYGTDDPLPIKPKTKTSSLHEQARRIVNKAGRRVNNPTSTMGIAASKVLGIPLDVLEMKLKFSERLLYYQKHGLSDPIRYDKDVDNIKSVTLEQSLDNDIVTLVTSLYYKVENDKVKIKKYTQVMKKRGDVELSVTLEFLPASDVYNDHDDDDNDNGLNNDDDDDDDDTRESDVGVKTSHATNPTTVGEYPIEPSLRPTVVVKLTGEPLRLENLYQRGMDLLSSQQYINQFKGYEKLMEASKGGHNESSVIIASQRLFGSQFLQEDSSSALEVLDDLAKNGLPSAQRNLAFLHASGLILNCSQSKALLYYTFSALGDDSQAQMALGYRFWSGIGVEADCETALEHYRSVAMKVALASEQSSRTSTPTTRIRLLDEDNNGATASGLLDDDLIQYYQFLADKGDVNAMVGLGQLYFHGARGVGIDYNLAHHYFTNAGNLGNSNAIGYLGKLYLEGNPIYPQNNETAYKYFQEADLKDNSVGQHGLGLIYLRGSGKPMDIVKAFAYFNKAASQGHSDAQYKLATMYYHGITGGRTDFKLALKWFKMAAQSGHVLAMYELGKMHAGGIGVMRTCHTATELFKNVAERGNWQNQFAQAHKLYRNHEHRKQAFYIYSLLAEMGYEVAQSNVAYILDKGGDSFYHFTKYERFHRALQHLTRAANQGNTMARLRIGDYHYFGLGTGVDFVSAASQYRLASEVPLKNAQAMFNLAYMFEMGLGMNKDMHLAKRFYDMSIEASDDAYIPVSLALFKLSIKFLLESIFNFVEVKSDGVPWDLHWYYTELPYSYLGPSWDLYALAAIFLVLVSLYTIRRGFIARWDQRRIPLT